MNEIAHRWPSVVREGIVSDPRFWQTSAGYEFQAVFGNGDQVAALSATNDGMDGYGWVCTSLTVTEGSTGDFLSSGDLDPTYIDFGSSSDVLTSPVVFGSYEHAVQAARFLGYQPTKLNLECYFKFNATTSETGTFIGFTAPSTTSPFAAGAGAAICIQTVGSVVFDCAGGGNSDAGSAADTSWHKFRITVDATNTEWFIDDVSQGTFTTATDVWPCAVKAKTFSNTTRLAWLRVFYN